MFFRKEKDKNGRNRPFRLFFQGIILGRQYGVNMAIDALMMRTE